MSYSKKRLRMVRLWRAPRTAWSRVEALYQRIPPLLKFTVACVLLVLPTTLLISHYPFSVIRQYQPGDIAREDIVIPLHFQWTNLQIQPDQPPALGEGGDENRYRQQVLVRAGEPIPEAKIALLDAVRRYQRAERKPQRWVGLLALVCLIYFVLYKAAVNNPSGRIAGRRAFWVAGTAILIEAVLIRIGMFIAAVLSTRPETMQFGDVFTFQFAIPFAVAALILAVLIGNHLAMMAALITALLAGLVSSIGTPMSIYALAGAVTAVYSVQRYRTRNAILRGGVAIALANTLIGVAVLLIANHALTWRTLLNAALAGIVGALFTTAVASVGVPIYESAFGILTDIKLLELSNAELPLLRQLAIQTPGTNHHSFVVGTLAEAAAKAIGANALLARVGCLYHDIGKLAAPKMYIENQQGAPNPHDRISPRDSVRVITGHVRRGIQLAEEANLPQAIIDFIPQHHGTRVLAYFFHKAKAQAEAQGEVINVEEFRYPGPKPQTKEAVILMLADGSEAAVRSLEDPTPENIRAIVKKIVDNVTADGQLDECDITFRELTLIREALIRALVGMYHQRISYPGFNPPGEGQSPDSSSNGAGVETRTEPQAVPVEDREVHAQTRR